ncbi:unnamed protein product, partial [Gulo gulo]
IRVGEAATFPPPALPVQRGPVTRVPRSTPAKVPDRPSSGPRRIPEGGRAPRCPERWDIKLLKLKFIARGL